MNPGPIDVYRPRAVVDLGTWTAGAVAFKLYGLLARGKAVTPDMLSTARRFLDAEVLARVEAMGESNGLGFVIVHPGDTGLSIAAHWWAQGSVLCQHIHRRQYDEAAAMDTVTRPVVACVWELALIHAEQAAWRATMMTLDPDPSAYLSARAPMSAV